MVKKIIILGATGSIGTNTIDLLRTLKSYNERISLVGISAHIHEDALLKIAEEFNVHHISLTGKTPNSDKIKYQGEHGLINMLNELEADIVVHGIPGITGLNYSIEALKSGKDLALANKETVVLAGNLIFDLAKQNGCSIIPTDSEHNAIFQLIRHRPAETIKKIILTASGGPFRNYSLEQLKQVSLEDALKHPTWNMGEKITIDSATLANKGLEVIETERFFGFTSEQIDVVVHPQSIIHSMVQTIDNSIYAQIGKADMKIPIMNAVFYPELGRSIYNDFNFSEHTLTFQKPDMEKFPMLKYALEALSAGGSYSIVFNCINDFAVQSFIRKKINFLQIPALVHDMLSLDWSYTPQSFEDVFSIQNRALELSDEKFFKYL
ncbi:MAG: 1-deoxy-D-xylulose-5-phosphate reductoisomerase [Spirochaetia bacterium]|nr:1-deoxy-D-xylulose-5-phosphate reductoisomerase [Spirochaetia bacterium]MCF7946904.1 1-deoxy-D-xylulose-5-phosphate reductoisomerase [Spirochaetia bacterium]